MKKSFYFCVVMEKPEVCYENKDFLVVYKPHGLNTDTDRKGNPSLERWLQETRRKPIYLLHRLDRPVSGLVLCAKKKSALHGLQRNWKNFAKRYLAVIEGNISPPAGTLQHFHQKDCKGFRAVLSSVPRQGFEPCSLTYKTIEQNEQCTLVEIELLTGKYHQIRAQFAWMGHPIVGDTFYGAHTVIPSPVPVIALTAYQLGFYYPDPTHPYLFTRYPKEPFTLFFPKSSLC